MKYKGKWFKGNFFSLRVSSKKTEEWVRKYAKGIKKPIAVETKKINGITYSRFYYKPVKPGEFWD